MQFRKVELWILITALVAGLALSPGTIDGDASRMWVIFLGLVSASILPSISLLVGSMTASGRSVLAIDELNTELKSAMEVLFLLFGCTAVAVIALVSLAIPSPAIFVKIPYLASEVLPRVGQAVVITFTTITVLRFGQIPAILRRSLAVRHKIAIEEARRKTLENAPTAVSARAAFPTHPDFGRQVSLEDVSRTGTDH